MKDDSIISVDLRVVSEVIKDKPNHSNLSRSALEVKAKEPTGDTMEIKAIGKWDGEYLISLHVEAYPGCGAIPVIGDNIRVTVEQAPNKE